ncbi:transcriptional regulator, LysR family [Methyloglobulus morosus KoM1]|uniref:Transcriptional regulator, LysR family n=1 Tax=Methyloglobulus morosus KoM1 TaxID=1116472 RepID=V5B471_9GAMM|nr:LysR family transcriptional regulator [Methyloglobulus morosus]ESS68005.1 transcriptional regulator, LysR family [Methyloglobulus morosus KoM1]
MDKLTGMTVFVRVAKAGSFAAGARELGISRAMATKHIMQLEGSLGSRLFNRTTRSLNLTDVGASYLERCQQVLLDIEEMEAAVTQLQTEPKGVLKISAPPVIGATHITRAVVEFLKIHPDLKIDIILQGSPGDLIDEGIDIAIYLGALDDTSMVARKLATSPLVVCASPDYLVKHGIPKTPEELEHHSCLVNWAIAPRHKWQFRTETGLKIITVSGRVQTNAAHSIRIAAINGLGLVMLPTYIVGGDIEKGLLKVVLDDYALPPLDIHAVYPHRKYLSTKVRSFLDFLQEWLGPRAGRPSIE